MSGLTVPVATMQHWSVESSFQCSSTIMQHHGSARLRASTALLLSLPGYCPGWTTVPVSINGSNKHTGRMPDSAELDRATLKSDQRHTASE